MLIYVVLVLLIVIAVVAILAMKMEGTPALSTFPYEGKTLFSATERSFLGVLDQAVPSGYRVFGKVRLADVAEVKKGLSNSERQSALNKVSSKHLDFLLCDAKDLAPICAIELDDRSHSSAGRQARDSFIEDVLKSLNLPLLRVSARKAYSIPEIQQEIERVTGRKMAEVAATAKEETVHSQEPVRQSPAGVITDARTKDATAKTCPKCGAAMLLRKANKGPNAGQIFWGCSAYPACRTIIKAGSSPAA
jgi:hypothetical protein